MMNYIYLHGFASSPQSLKAQFFLTKLESYAIKLEVPDLNLNDFKQLKISRQIDYLKSKLKDGVEYTLIGSSLGGLLCLLLAEELPLIKKLVLIAPALEIKELWSRELGSKDISTWKETGFCSVYHSGFKQEKILDYGFIEDMQSINDRDFNRELPVLILHGECDTVVPSIVSERYIKRNSLATLVEITDGGHGLEDQLEDIWQFCENYLFKLG